MFAFAYLAELAPSAIFAYLQHPLDGLPVAHGFACHAARSSAMGAVDALAEQHGRLIQQAEAQHL